MWGERVSQSRVACKGIMATTGEEKVRPHAYRALYAVAEVRGAPLQVGAGRPGGSRNLARVCVTRV